MASLCSPKEVLELDYTWVCFFDKITLDSENINFGVGALISAAGLCDKA